MQTSRKISLKTAESSAWKKAFTNENSANAESVITFCDSAVFPAGYDQTAVANGEIEVRIVAFLQRFHQNRRVFQVIEDVPAVLEAESLHTVFLEGLLRLSWKRGTQKYLLFEERANDALRVLRLTKRGKGETTSGSSGFPTVVSCGCRLLVRNSRGSGTVRGRI